LKTVVWTDGWVGSLARTGYRLLWVRLRGIPDREVLWRSVYKPDQIKRDGTLKHGFFRDRRGLSCDLARFSTVDGSRMGTVVPPVWPPTSGLARFAVRHVRVAGTDVEHVPLRAGVRVVEGESRPERANYAHCQFKQELTTAQAKQLARETLIDPLPTFEAAP
jgi:hypothetical protein